MRIVLRDGILVECLLIQGASIRNAAHIDRGQITKEQIGFLIYETTLDWSKGGANEQNPNPTQRTRKELRNIES